MLSRSTFMRVIPTTALIIAAAGCDDRLTNPPATDPEIAAAAGGFHWATNPLPTGFIASALWASSPSDIFVAGSYGNTDNRAVLHFDGQRWTEQLRGFVRALWGSSPNDVYAAGGTAQAPSHLWHYDGAGWQVVTTEPLQPSYYAIWGTAPQDVFAVGGNDATTRGEGLVVHYNGVSWSSMGSAGFTDQGSFIYDVSGTSPVDVYAVGYQPAPSDNPEEFFFTQYRVIHYDGTGWSLSFQIQNGPPVPPNSISLSGVWPVAQNNVFLVGSAGHIYQFDGTTWAPMASPTTEDLHDVWGNAGSNVYAVGDGGIFRYDGTRWRVIEPTPGIGVWGAGSNLFVIRKDGGAILQGRSNKKLVS